MSGDTYIPSVNVPKEHALILSELIKLDQSAIDSIIDIYKTLTTLLQSEKAAEALRLVLPEDFPYDSEQVQSILLSASTTVNRSDVGKDRVVEDIKRKIEEVRNSNVGELEANNLSRLLSDPKGISRSSDLREIYYAHDKAITNFRIITDIRPIFADDDEQISIDSLTAYHNLQITYLEDGLTKRTYFSLDSSDIRQLLKIANRAIQKEAVITKKDSLAKSVNLIGVE